MIHILILACNIIKFIKILSHEEMLKDSVRTKAY